MFAIVLLFLLVALKYFEVWAFKDMSWWWVALGALLLYLWFEFGERILGLDKRQAHAHFEKVRKERVKRTFEQEKKKRR